MSFDAALHLVALSRPEEALRKLAESFDPEDAWHWWIRALALLEVDRVEEAVEAARSGLAVEPESPMLLGVLARCHIERDDLVAAEEAALGALRLDAEDADQLALYALIVAKAGQLEKARKLVARARNVDPENASALRIEAALALVRGNDREALERSKDLLAINPEDVHAHRLAGGVLHDRGEIAAASQHLRTAVISDPSDSELADAARQNLVWRHPMMWPLRPIKRFGIGPVWIAGVAALFFSSRFAPPPVSATIAALWVAYCVYSWVVPPLVRKRVNAR